MQSAESPATYRLLPSQLPLGDVTVYVTSITPFWGRKKSCTPRLASSSERLNRSVGLVAEAPAPPCEVNVRSVNLKKEMLATSVSEAS